jgi:multicomponent Na+:H+ antiporter subunit E
MPKNMKEAYTYIIHLLISVLAVFLLFKFSSIENHFGNNLLAFIASYTILWLASFVYDRSHFVKVPRALALFGYFIKELVVASLFVAWDVITPKSYVESGIIALPLDARKDFEITLLASLISLTPGTLSIDLSEDKRVLYVHAVYIKDGDIEGLKRQLKNGFERKLLSITRKYHG